MADKKKTYSESMNRLDEILENIDQANIPIDELANQVIEAAGLLKNCKTILTDTEAKVKNVLEDLESDFTEAEDVGDEQ
ncbi:MAG: exodeoxyribonuclease VII small subunit [Fibrobacteria bacterium]|nr:exodeoxyribonuclease VII small subunit [Fibrobacteria bacterium]